MNETVRKVVFFSLTATLGLVLALAMTPTAQAEDSNRVASFNIRFNNPDDGENASPHRRDWVGDLIREQHP